MTNIWDTSTSSYASSSDPERSNTSAMWADLQGDGWRGLANVANPIVGFRRGVFGRKAHAAALKAFREAQDRQDAASLRNKVGQRGMQLDQLQNESDQGIRGGITNLDAAFSDPSREAERQQQYQTNLNSAYANLGDQYQQGSRSNAINAARRGTLGGSTDIEHQSNLAAAYQGGLQSAVGKAIEGVRGSRDADQRQFHSLRRGLLSGDPGTQAQFAAQADRDRQDQARASRAQDFSMNNANLRRQGMDIQSQLYGNLGYTGADYIDRNYGGGY